MSVTKRRATIHHAPGDSRRPRPRSPTRRRPLATASGAAPRSARERSASRRKPRNAKPFRRRRRSRRGRGRADRAGEGDPLFAAGAGLALLDAFLRRDPPAAGALRPRLALQSAAASAKILRLNADEGALRDLRFAVGDDARARGEAAVAVARPRRPAAQPRRRPARRRGGAARPGSAGPERPRIQPEGLRRGGRSGLRGGARPPLWPSPPSRTPQPPKPKSSPFGLFDLVLAIRLRWPRPAAADRDENSGSQLCGRRATGGGQGRATQPGQTPPRARSRSPPPRPSTSPPISPAAPTPCSPSRPNCAPNRRQKSSTCCSPKIASRPPRRPATRR